MSREGRRRVLPRDHPLMPVLAGVIAIFTVLAIVVWAPTGPTTTLTGRITAMGLGHSRYGPRPRVSVALADRTVDVDTFAVLDCTIGDALAVRRQPHLWGSSYRAGEMQCPSRPVGQQAIEPSAGSNRR